MQVCQDIIEGLPIEPDLLRTVMVMKHGVFNMTRKPNTRAVSERLRRRRRQRKQGSQKSKVSHVGHIFRCEMHRPQSFLPQDETINQEVCREILRRLLRSVHEKRRELWQENP